MTRTDRMPRVEWPLRPGYYDVKCKSGHIAKVRVESGKKTYRRCPVCGIKAFFRRSVA